MERVGLSSLIFSDYQKETVDLLRLMLLKCKIKQMGLLWLMVSKYCVEKSKNTDISQLTNELNFARIGFMVLNYKVYFFDG